MSNFNPQFSVTQARADYSGIQNAGRGIANGIAMFAQKKRQEKAVEEEQKIQQSVSKFFESGKVDKYKDPQTGMYKKDAAAKDPMLAGLPAEYRAGVLDTLDGFNESTKEQKAAEENFLKGRAQQLAMGDGSADAYAGLSPEQQKQVFSMAQPLYADYMKQRSDMENTQIDNDRADRDLALRERISSQPDKPSAADAEIERFMRANPGTSWVDAYNAVNTKTIADPGGTGLYRVTPDGSTEKVEVNRWTPPSKEELLSEEFHGAPSLRLYDKIDNQLTGLVPSMRQAAQSFIVGPINSVTDSEFSAIPPEIQQTVQEFKSVQRSLVKSMQENPKYPEGERKSIAEELNIEPSAFKDAQSMRAYIRGSTEFLNRKLENAIRIRDDESRPNDERGAAQIVAENIAFALYQLGVPTAGTKSTADMTTEELIEYYGN